MLSWAAVAKRKSTTNFSDDNINEMAGYASPESFGCPSIASSEHPSASQMTQSTNTETNENAVEMITRCPSTSGTVAAPKQGRVVGAELVETESPKTQTMMKMEDGGTRKVPLTVTQYNAMLQKELNYRLWHNGNLSQTITRNLADYNLTELKLRALIRRKKEEYESTLEGLFGHDQFEMENVHQLIAIKLHSAPNKKSGTMEKAAKVLEAGRSALAPNQSFDEWRREIDEFMNKLKTTTALSINEHLQIRLFALRNLVEMAKVNENRLLLELQVIAEQYHHKLGTLRLEFNWWRRRMRELLHYAPAVSSWNENGNGNGNGNENGKRY